MKPILVVAAIPDNGGIVFLHRERQISIGEKNVDAVWKILRHCNGYNDILSIADLSGIEVAVVQEIVDSLVELEVIVDSGCQYQHFHRISSYPEGYLTNLTQVQIAEYTDQQWMSARSGKSVNFSASSSLLQVLLKNRRSCRTFSEQKLTVDQIGSICHYAYHIPSHAVPSGGALYPLHIFVMVEEEQQGINAGYYEYDAIADQLIQLLEDVDTEALKYCFNFEQMPFGSSVQIIIAADLDRQPYKYSNRGYRLTMIEAGHAAEHICLYCAEQGLGACELGGILDEPMRVELGLSDSSIYPLLGIAVGWPGNATKDTDKISFVESMVGGNKPVKGVYSRILEHNSGFYGAISVYQDGSGKHQYAGATSPCYADVLFKATIEGYERWMSGQVRSDFYGTAEELTRRGMAWIGLAQLSPLTEEQSQKCGLRHFTSNLSVRWVKGKRVRDGMEIYIPTDIVFYGQEDDGNRIYYGHSSGIAAHFDYKKAKVLAMTELIERDAIMRNWYSRVFPERLSKELLPVHAKKRIQYWKDHGREMMFLEMPSEYGEVIEVAIFSDSYPYFVCGAAATIRPQEIEHTIIKALYEAEYNLLLSMNERDEIGPKDVRTPADHGKLYCQKEYANTLEWLRYGCEIDEFTLNQELNYDNLLRQVDAIVVELGEVSELKVVRVLSPRLVPINFGYNTAHYIHPEVVGRINMDSLKLPHYFS